MSPKTAPALLLTLLAGETPLCHAQFAQPYRASPDSALAAPFPFTQTMAPAVPIGQGSRTAPHRLESAEDSLPSITTLLRLTNPQTGHLDRAYDGYARIRLEQEARIAEWEEELKTAQAVTTFNERRAGELARDISGSDQKVSDAYLKARGAALTALTSDQRRRLEELQSRRVAPGEGAFAPDSVRDDKYAFLLLSQVEDIWRTPVDTETAQALLAALEANTAATNLVQRGHYQSYHDYLSFYYDYYRPVSIYPYCPPNALYTYPRPDHGHWVGRPLVRPDNWDRHSPHDPPNWDRRSPVTEHARGPRQPYPSGLRGSATLTSVSVPLPPRGGIETGEVFSIHLRRSDRSEIRPRWDRKVEPARQRDSPRAPGASETPRSEPARSGTASPEPKRPERSEPKDDRKWDRGGSGSRERPERSRSEEKSDGKKGR
ncbi:MAG: hypothetical protein H7Z41_00970 [Cytophagales bacterium]|nr:hypothetical protein [Armatimonadota bacterium]